MTTAPEPAKISPYLTVNGASDAIALYQKVFGAKENARMMAQDGKRLMHADLTINGGRVLLSDEFAEFDGGSAPLPDRKSPVSVAVSYDSPTEVDATFARAIEAGCKSELDPHDAFFGSRFAMLNDPFGHRWMLVAPLPQQA
ncbi:VOC family protein [Microvirga rosea]|uniref:VOC family protein n=1 Tax=Microvirga rosea TaxID=2715425 RepID=UPI001D0A842C|nr:glyoxalase/bleomycin resistance/extradiol dioxygenase family protein [Microvirga rosea]MCB8820408.1 glyoxalase/bleomycin resistance/extradiol dioxygenase family protein [Microvirga rosea]